jgi:hypothetical protein
MAEMNCNNCRFFTNQQIMGICKRYPTHQNRHENDWCGEHHAQIVNIVPLQVYDITTDNVVERKRGRKPKDATPSA